MLIALILIACSEKEPQETGAPPIEDTAPEFVDVDGDGFKSDEDCDEEDASVYPGAEELCDDVDQDCDEQIDEGVLETYWLDADEDGYGAEDFSTEGCSPPEGYVDNDEDCDDTDDAYHPAATEDDCTDPNDYNCDGSVAYEDVDGDGHAACEDCDDSNDAVGPGELELCDGLDNDCDDLIDNDPIDGERYYEDSDEDGYGNADISSKECELPTGYADNDDDCDDAEATAFPGNDEACDDIDNDCDGDVDEGEGEGTLWYEDKDSDGLGTPYSTKTACLQPSGYVDNSDDCDDSTGSVGAASTWYADTDTDTYGDATSTTDSCTQPSGYVDNDEDCDDADKDVNPDADEECDTVDNDCDGDTDEDDAIDANTFYEDSDSDGEGDPNSTTTSCDSSVSGYVSNDDDCDDTDKDVNTDADEECDTVDNDCDGDTDEDDAIDADTWYEDSDGDSYGDESSTTTSCSQPSGYVAATTTFDCDDTDEDVNPGASEACNGEDDDCDGDTDEGFTSTPVTWYEDSDSDGEGDPSSTTVDCNQPSGYVSNDDDCDDTDGDVNTSADEECDDVDNDCDGDTDEDDAIDATTWTEDQDSDGYGSTSGSTTVACDEPTGYAATADDCDDGDADVNPGATEVCDDVDNDCDGDTDDDDTSVTGQTTWTEDSDSDGYGSSSASASTITSCDQPSGYVDNTDDCNDSDGGIGDALTWYEDTDSDGEGDPSSSSESCTQPSGYVSNDDDCDDGDGSVNTSADEYCDSIDNDCDGDTDENDAVDVSTFYADTDNDGYGDASSTTEACSAPTGYVSDDTDCDDGESTVNPGASEICDDLDNDCNGDTDDDDSGVTDQTTWTEDGDGDGFGDKSASANTETSCDQPSSYVNDNTDCDDSDDSIYPGAVEYCDSADNDCDGTTDEDDAVDASTWYTDGDNDGYGDESSSVTACSQPSGAIATGGDCDDTDGSVYPGADEYCSDSTDNDCDDEIDEDDAVDASTWYLDNDTDGYGNSTASQTACTQPSGFVSDDTDCDDTDGSTYPGASETCFDGVVNDCNGTASSALAQCTLTGTVGLASATTVTGEKAGDTFSTSLVSAGDVDSDGYDDFWAGSPLVEAGSVSNAGAVYLVYGPATSGAVPTDTVIYGSVANDKLGSALDVVDQDGDGTDDLLVGAVDDNRLYLFTGPLTGSITNTDATYVFDGQYSGDKMGTAVLGVDDMDSDGVADFVFSAPGNDSAGTNRGAVYLAYGYSSSITLTDLQRIDGEANNDALGDSLASGDFNGDGTEDLVFGSPLQGGTNNGRVYVFHGPISSGVNIASSGEIIVSGASNGDQLGYAVAADGDYNGDGYDDLVMGAPYDDDGNTDAGVLFVLFGTTSTGNISSSMANVQVSGGLTSELLGSSVSYVPDADSDGDDEVLFGAPGQSDNGLNSGVAFLAYGATTTLDKDATIGGSSTNDNQGSAVLYLGDTDADGIDEIGIGANGHTADKGAMYILELAAY